MLARVWQEGLAARVSRLPKAAMPKHKMPGWSSLRAIVQGSTQSSFYVKTLHREAAGLGFLAQLTDKHVRISVRPASSVGPTAVRGSHSTPVVPHAPQKGCLGPLVVTQGLPS